MSKEKEMILNLLELYKDMPYLWDKNDNNFMNKNARHEGFQVLLTVYKNIDENATIKTVKKKIDNLKTNYNKELKKVKELKHTGAGNEDVYVPSIWYYDSLSFLESTTESCRSVMDTIENEDSSSCTEDTQMTTSADSASNKKLFKRKKKEAPLKQQHDILERASNLMNTKEEDWEILGRSIGMQLRDLNKSQHTIARKLISDVIFYATLHKLSEESFVSVTPTNNYRATSMPSYLQFTPSRSSSSQSEFHSPVHISSPPQRIQSPSSHPLPPTQYPIQSLDSPLHTLPLPYQTQSLHPSTSKQYHMQSPNSPLHTLPSQHPTQSPHPSTSTQYNSQSVNSSTVQYTVQVPHPSDPQPSQSIQLHIPSPPPQSSTPNLYEPDETVSFIEGSAEVLKEYLIFPKK